jgi:tetratricopeptide (TPR) repeat protein
MSAGQFFDLIMPAAFVLSALISAWVLASARKRFQFPYAIALAIGTLFLPLIVLPVYLVTMMWNEKIGPPKKWRYTLPLLYATLVFSAIGIFYYLDDRSVDAHLARATQARLVEDSGTAIREYREALALEDDPHIHKLLAIQLANSGYVSEAISEFRLAQQGDDPDDSINYSLGLLLERMNLTNQAAMEFQQFLASQTCQQPDARCEAARERLEN